MYDLSDESLSGMRQRLCSVVSGWMCDTISVHLDHQFEIFLFVVFIYAHLSHGRLQLCLPPARLLHPKAKNVLGKSLGSHEQQHQSTTTTKYSPFQVHWCTDCNNHLQSQTLNMNPPLRFPFGFPARVLILGWSYQSWSNPLSDTTESRV
jgi:hypothetical protein